ncbi:aldehyde dehydrogenase [Ulvibacter litoralis]|uniref:Aldehyde dehydrogenase n=1 Tax=Ulvibacter litoralis TaxID=227084 RepID=A0A1G7I289_9FLAO|nr:aldehyde dehydrogenase [Ulvibacter litoralis]GHC62755.1 aldehyde dehydrogenase [Ulvibacter litoralis]SDF06718.1 aldehyde dehydrogenase (NAD+) [Ulvibacter litoralis]
MVDLIANQRAFFNTNETKETDFRIKQLKKLKTILKQNEDKLNTAIYEDFGKSEYETYLSELLLTYQELNDFIKKIKSWSKKKRVRTNLANFPAKSYIIPEPLGVTLVIGAWNYPIQLSLVPAITALAAGNTVVLKPSELPNKTAAVLAEIINSNFSKEYFCVVEGGIPETTALLKQKFDKIFFTGSSTVGKIVYKAAAEHLTPVTLELGGKNPTFVFADCNLKVTAQRIVWAKYLNAGQTCVAPDYILVEKSIEDAFLSEVKKEIDTRYKLTDDIKDNYLRIINEKNFDRLTAFIQPEKVYCGGITNKKNRFISPTVLTNVSFDDEIMKDEIFGPILPVIPFENLDAMIQKVKENPKPLSCYVYTKNRKVVSKLLNEISFGGGAINESIMHLTNSKLPFGGVGFSGIGSYHGEAGFRTFSHYKSILDKPFWLEPSLKYTPYTLKKLNLFKFLFE